MLPRDSGGDLVIVSVITVVRNDPAGFQQTLNSLETQTSSAFEWVVIDSSDNKSEIAALIDASSLSATYRWVNPEGIYPAMNIGARKSTGDYLYFLNSGDTLADSQTLHRVELALNEVAPVWAFGGVHVWNRHGQQLHEPHWEYKVEFRHRFGRGRFPPHQSVFVHKDAFAKLGEFNSNFLIAADYNMICQLSKIEEPLELGFVIANFTQGGASTVSWRSAQREFRQIRRTEFPPNLVQRIEETYFGAKAYASHLVANGFTSSKE
jgi:glycosyltransferase involved in cell wall biosynthesis